MTAAFRVGGLYRNGLLEADRLGRVLQSYLQATRHFLGQLCLTRTGFALDQ